MVFDIQIKSVQITRQKSECPKILYNSVDYKIVNIEFSYGWKNLPTQRKYGSVRQFFVSKRSFKQKMNIHLNCWLPVVKTQVRSTKF